MYKVVGIAAAPPGWYVRFGSGSHDHWSEAVPAFVLRSGYSDDFCGGQDDDVTVFPVLPMGLGGRCYPPDDEGNTDYELFYHPDSVPDDYDMGGRR